MTYAPETLLHTGIGRSKDESGLRGNELELRNSHAGKYSKEGKNTIGLPCEVAKRRVWNFLPS